MAGTASIGVILAGFGYLRSLDDLPDYLARITGRAPTDEAVAALRARYEAIGGPGPLEGHTNAQVTALQANLGPEYVVVSGLRNSAPFLPDVAEQLARSGVRRLVSIALAPQYGKQSVEGYHDGVREGLARVPKPPRASFVRSYATHPQLIAYWRDAVLEALGRLPANLRAEARVLFTVHSVPYTAMADPPFYPAECRATAKAVAAAAGVRHYGLAFQSGHAGAWLGPDESEMLERLARQGARAVILAPIGFVAEHLETLWDLDIEGAETARELGIVLERGRAPNEDPRFIEALADSVRRQVV